VSLFALGFIAYRFAVGQAGTTILRVYNFPPSTRTVLLYYIFYHVYENEAFFLCGSRGSYAVAVNGHKTKHGGRCTGASGTTLFYLRECNQQKLQQTLHVA